MTITRLCLLFAVIMCIASTELCDVNLIIDGATEIYFLSEHSNSCYIFGMKEMKMIEARRKCRSFGGNLTDITSSNKEFIEASLQREELSKHKYWIGLMWNYHLQEWYWDKGEEYVTHDNKEGGRCYGVSGRVAVAVMSSKGIDYKSYGDMHDAFICRLDLTCSGDGHDLENNTNNNINSSSSACSERCLNYLSRYNGSTVTTPTPSYSTSTLPSTIETTPGENKTAGDGEQNRSDGEQSRGDGEQSNQTGCKIKPEDVDTTNTVIVAVLGGVCAGLLAAVLIMSIVICKYRRLLNSKERQARISLVDILEADHTDTGKERPTDFHNSQPGSTSELLHNSSDTYTVPHKNAERQTSDNPYKNKDQEPGIGSVSEPPIHGLEDSLYCNSQADNNYSHLDHAGSSQGDVGPQNLYGMESATSPFPETQSSVYEPQSPVYEPQSPTYESCM